MEARGVGTPVVAFDSTGIHDLVRQGWVQPVSRDADPREVAAELCAALRSGRQEPPADLPSWDDAAAGLATIYTDLATQGGGR
jgi:glycosyltransferase involved in cell wall biosynthesis